MAQRVIENGRALRAARARNLHVVPSITLNISHPGYIGVLFYELGKSKKGNINQMLFVYLQRKRGHLTVAAGNNNQAW